MKEIYSYPTFILREYMMYMLIKFLPHALKNIKVLPDNYFVIFNMRAVFSITVILIILCSVHHVVTAPWIKIPANLKTIPRRKIQKNINTICTVKEEPRKNCEHKRCIWGKCYKYCREEIVRSRTCV